MDFFSEQDQARRSSKLLIVLFSIAVIILIVLTNVLVAMALWLLDEQLVGNYQAYQNAIDTLNYQGTRGIVHYFSVQKFFLITLFVCGVIGSAIAFKSIQLSGGGKKIAEKLGGRRLLPNTNAIDEKRVLNVVEEMALASGMPTPSVYLLDNEIGINAFAAGSTPADAVIGITRGCLDQFNREQLQGVIAHEFSHILNGDIRLNSRLIAVLHGIVFVGLVGDIVLRGGASRSSQLRRRSGRSQIALLGFSLIVIGWLGRFFGSWIKSAVSRQREYLADACAVQFTRNPNGIAQALKIIGGYLPSAKLQSSSASEMSHLFFGQAVSNRSDIFATHPPLAERITRIEPNWDGHYIVREQKNSANINAIEMAETPYSALNAGPLAQTSTVDTTAGQTADHSTMSNTGAMALLRGQVHDPFDAIAVVFSLFLSEDSNAISSQYDFIRQSGITGIEQQTRQLQTAITALDRSKRLPLIELALPALKCMSKNQYTVFCRTLLLLIRADKKFELFEWCLYQVLRHYLDQEFGRSRPSRPIHKSMGSVAKDFQLVLSMLAHYGNKTIDDKKRAFGRGANSAGLYTIALVDREQCSMDSFVKAVNQLANCYPLLKPRLLKALRDCARNDQVVSIVEREILSAVAAVMDCPIPVGWAEQ